MLRSENLTFVAYTGYYKYLYRNWVLYSESDNVTKHNH